MQSGLPVLASINPGNDLIKLIEDERVGRVYTDPSAVSLMQLAEALVDEIALNAEIKGRCKALAAKLFSPEMAVKQIVQALRT